MKKSELKTCENCEHYLPDVITGDFVTFGLCSHIARFKLNLIQPTNYSCSFQSPKTKHTEKSAA